MKKIMVVIGLIAALVLAGKTLADEFYRPIYGFANTTSTAWTNNINDPVIVRNIMFCAGRSNENVTISSVVNGGVITNVLATNSFVGMNTNTLPVNLFLVLEIGDKIVFTSDVTVTNTPASNTSSNRYIIYLQKNMP